MNKQFVHSWVSNYGVRAVVNSYPEGWEFVAILTDARETVERDGGRIFIYEVLHTGQLKLVAGFAKVGSKVVEANR